MRARPRWQARLLSVILVLAGACGGSSGHLGAASDAFDAGDGPPDSTAPERDVPPVDLSLAVDVAADGGTAADLGGGGEDVPGRDTVLAPDTAGRDGATVDGVVVDVSVADGDGTDAPGGDVVVPSPRGTGTVGTMAIIGTAAGGGWVLKTRNAGAAVTGAASGGGFQLRAER